MERDMNEIKHYLIYMYTFPNGKKYIGKSTRSMNRRQGHDWNRYQNCTLLWKAIQKYGTDNVKTDILFEGDINHNEAAEYYHVKQSTISNWIKQGHISKTNITIERYTPTTTKREEINE